jgi:hypothetical protein
MQQPAMTVRRLAGTRAHDERGVPADAGTELPRWENFPAEDRQHLVRVMIQTARRQVQRRPPTAERR